MSRSSNLAGARRREARPLSFHPSLFFTVADLDAIRARCASVVKPQFDLLIQDAAAHLDDAPPSTLEGGYEKKGDQLQDPFLTRILDFSFLAVLTGEARYLDAARRWTLTLAEMPALAGEIDVAAMRCANCGYPEGWAVTALAVAYDWLYPRWSPEERALLRERIRLLTKVLHDAAVDGEWWSRAYLHHDTWIPLGGLGLGAMSIVGEVAEARAWAERAEHEIAAALDWLDADGAWPEGPCGWAFALAAVTPFWDAYARRFPARGRALLDNAWLAATWRFRLYARTPDGRFLGFGDCRESGGYQSTGDQGAPALRWLAARYQNPHAQWLAAREWEQRPNPFTAAWEILWTDPSVPEAPPDDLPRAAVFENQAIAYLHTGWERSSTVLAFRGTGLLGRRATALVRGDNLDAFNNSISHAQADANAFGIWSRGDFAVTLAKYGQRATEFQNSLLVDGHGQYTRYGDDHPGSPEGEITAFFSSPSAASVSAEAARCYPPGLRSFSRRMTLIEPGVVFLHDRVMAEAPARLGWRFHVDGEARVDLGEGGFSSVVNGRTTIVRFAGPRRLRLGQLTDDYNRAVTVTLAEESADAALVAVILPSLPEDARASLSTPSQSSFVIEALGVTVLGAFAAGPVAVPGRLAADGTAAVAWRRGDAWDFFAVESGWLGVDGEILFEASSPVTLSASRTGGSTRLTVATPRAVEVRIAVGARRWATVRARAGVSTHEI